MTLCHIIDGSGSASSEDPCKEELASPARRCGFLSLAPTPEEATGIHLR